MEKSGREAPLGMLALQRRRKILELIQEEGSARVSALSRVFKVSEPTVRQDLEKLEEEGHIIREHGGAFLKSIPQQVRSLSLQQTENMDKKASIGRKAAEFVADDDSLILDAGSTITELAKNLGARKNLKVVTNALNIALLLGTQMSCEIMVTGGEFKAPTLSLTGESAARLLERIHVGKCFLAARGVSLEAGLTYPGLSDLHLKKAMIEAATEVYLVADSTKIGATSFASLGPVELVRYFITDAGISEKDRKAFEARGITVIVA
jgi:DeoR/GlpR family transcriptional regulator of sugar metabolism